MRMSLVRCAAAVLVSAFLALPAPARPQGLTPQQRAGKQIYFEGTSATGRELRAFVSADTAVPASAVSCASCHGEDGLGRPEGGVVPPAITWSELTKRYGHSHAGGRKHPAFDARSAARAVTDGVDPAGNALGPAMPRYSLSREDAESLVAYLHVLEHDRDPGIADTSLRVATVLPTTGRLADVGEAMRKVMAASFADVNAGGGIHGRRLELVVAGYDSDRGGAADALRQLVARDPPFALVSGLAPGAESEIATLAERERLPLVAPYGGAPATAAAGRYAFYALAGLREQARVLVRYAAREAGAARPRTVVLHAPAAALADAARAAAADLGAAGFAQVEVVQFERGRLDRALAERLKRERVELVVFLGNDADLAALVAHADAVQVAPRVLASGTLVARAAADAPKSFEGRIFLAYPSLPTGERPAAMEKLAKLRERAGIVDRNRAAHVSAATAAALLAEGLRRSGRTLSRERLVDALEKIYGYDAGLVPRLSFGPARRVGALGAYIVAVDVSRHSFSPVSGFISLE